MVKFGKKFFFNNKYVKKNKTITIVVIITVILLILTTLFITSKFIEKNNLEPQKKIELYEQISINLYDTLPNKLTYFSHLENVDVNDIVITYPEDMTKENDYTNCTEDAKNTIIGIQNGQEYSGNIDELISCLNYKITKAGSYSVEIKIGSEEYSSELNVIDQEAPVLTVKDFEIFTDEKYEANDFVASCTDNSGEECEIKYLNTSIVDYSTYKDPGEYKIKLKAVDSSGNESEAQTATLTIKEIIYHTVTFNTNGGSDIESQKVRDGYTAQMPNTPTKSNYNFLGWYINNNEYDFTSPVTSDLTITAKWEKIQVSTPSGNSGGGNTGGSNTGGGSSGGSTSKCVKYSDAYGADVSIYNYQLGGGSVNDCMPNSSSSFSQAAQNLASNYKSKVLEEFKSTYLYDDEKGQCSTHISTSTDAVTYNGKSAGFKIKYSVTATCPSTVTSNRFAENYELECSSLSSCSF